MEQRHSAHGVRRVARNRSGGVNNSRNRIGNLTLGKLTPRKKLQHKEIIAGIRYDTSQGKIRKHYRHNNNKYSNTRGIGNETDKDNKDGSDIEKQERQRVEQESSCWFVPRLGNMQQDRPEGVSRLLGGNLNSASSRDVCDRKISDIIRVIETWDVQAGGFSEVGIKRRNMPRSKQKDSWFCSGTDMYQTLVANNHQEIVPTLIRQQGSIALFAGKEVGQYISNTEKDFRNLGRWNSWLIQSDLSHRTRMVVAYQVRQARQKGIQTIYQQHARYMALHNLIGKSWDLFQDDIAAITRFIENGNRLILSIDMNKHVLTGTLPWKLLCLGLHEATHEHWEDTKPHTYVYGDNKPIDGIYQMPDLVITALTQLLFHEGVGDHRNILVDISSSSLGSLREG